ncbi:Aldo/keto reductase [Marasmius fiardii PR-910]|nr:Aldo/keto reductase [Marasmius fiardii PR-910]
MPFEPILLNDGTKIPTISFGTGSLWKWQDVTEYIEQAIEVGFSHIDTADFYETEQYVGKAIRESGVNRDEIFVTTKWLYLGKDKLPVQDAIRRSLDQLNLRYVDLYLIHNPFYVPNQDVETAWREFEKVKQDGLAKSIGVSNANLGDLKRLLKTARIPPTVNQIELHPYNYYEQKPVMDYCASKNIVIEAYSSLIPIRRYPGGAVDKPLKKAAKRLGATPTQVLFLWVKAKGAIIVTTSSTKAHLEEYLAVGDLPSLTAEEIAAIDEAGAKGPPSDFQLKLRENRKDIVIMTLGLMLAAYLWFWA